MNSVLPLSSSLLEDIGKAATGPKPIMVQHLGNRRIAGFHHLATMSLDRFRDLDELKSAVKCQQESSSVHDPEDLIIKVIQQGARAIALCSASRPECFDLLIVNADVSPHDLARLCFDAQLHSLANNSEWSASNSPRTKVSKQTLSALHEYLSRRIPAYVSNRSCVPNLP